jgi:hypothetical protein
MHHLFVSNLSFPIVDNDDDDDDDNHGDDDGDDDHDVKVHVFI